MRIRTLTAALAALTLPLTACGSSAGDDPKQSKPADKPAPSKSVDCKDENLSQSDWIDHCQPKPQDPHLKVGQSYTWIDGVRTSVTKIERLTGPYQQGDTKPASTETLFRVHLKVTNRAEIPVDLGDISPYVEGATNGGTAATGTYQRGEEPLEGRLAPGGTVTKTEDNVIEKRYGDKVVVTVQRGDSSNDEPAGYPEFTGTIS